ncbi:MAG: DivIVA domain-containing protein [Melioribacteraceae bacterium]|nr:DivIVA domain-containing protein [Melioribacteraceae bacterium]
MKFTPYSIKSQEFNKNMRGYDIEEVTIFLESLSDEVEKLQAENESFKNELEKKNTRLEDFKKIEKTLQNTLLNAQESTTKTVETTKRQTALLIKEAELKASQIINTAKDEADTYRSTILKLREEKSLLIAQIRAVVDSQAELLLRSSGAVKTERPQIKREEPKEPKTDVNVDGILERLL